MTHTDGSHADGCMDFSEFVEMQNNAAEGRAKARRERIATAALQGMLPRGPWGYEQAAEFAVNYADALIALLDKEPSDAK